MISPRLSADIGGKKTNRVRIKARPKTEHSPQRAMRRYKQDPTARGMDTIVITVSMPVKFLAALDELCGRMHMARSHLVREAVEQLAARIK